MIYFVSIEELREKLTWNHSMRMTFQLCIHQFQIIFQVLNKKRNLIEKKKIIIKNDLFLFK